MEDNKLIDLAVKLARRIAQTPGITDEEIASDALTRAQGDEAAAETLADVAKSFAPVLREHEKMMEKEYGPTLDLWHKVMERLLEEK